MRTELASLRDVFAFWKVSLVAAPSRKSDSF
jgi:hypothetical protein